jgi:hypothetical protein
MKALDAYRDLKKELDKYESPTFTIRDFNFFFGKAVSLWIDDNYKKFDLIQKESDDLRSVYVVDAPLTVNTVTKSVALPTNYRHILDLRLQVKYTAKVGTHSVDEIDTVYPVRLKTSQKGFRFDRNAYQKPSYKRHYYEIHGTSILFHLDSSVLTINNVSDNLMIDYIREPDVVYLNPDKSADYNNTANNSVLFYNTSTTPNGIYYEVLNVARMIFLENIESRRAMEATRQSVTQ